MNNELFWFWQFVISTFFLYAFLFHFLPLRYSKRITAIFCMISFWLLGALGYWGIFFPQAKEKGVIITLLQVIVFQGTALIFCKYRDCRALFVGMTSSVFVMVGDLLATEIDVYSGNKAAGLIIQVIVDFLLLLLLIRVMKDEWEKEMELRPKGWGRFCVLPMLLYVISYYLSQWPINLYENPLNGIPILLLLLLVVYCYILVMEMLSADRKERNMQRSNNFLEMYAKGLQREMQITNQKEAEMRIYRHDTRHTYRLMEAYLEAGQTKQLKEFLEQLNGQIDEIKSSRYCENIAVNGIITMLTKKTDQEQVAFTCQTDIPAKLNGINEYEFATVISNLLENAIEAAAKVPEVEKRKVSIRVFPFKAQYMLEVRNTYSGSIELSKETGLPISHGGQLHGYGLQSVQAYVDKSGAIMNLSYTEDEFCVQLLLKKLAKL